MRINMAEQDAMRIAHEGYLGTSKPLSKSTSRRAAQDLNWWLGSPRIEGVSQERKAVAINVYLELAARVFTSIEQGTFPASFDCNEGSVRPDKGVIKACFQAQLPLLEAQQLNGELVFVLTQAGRAQFHY